MTTYGEDNVPPLPQGYSATQKLPVDNAPSSVSLQPRKGLYLTQLGEEYVFFVHTLLLAAQMDPVKAYFAEANISGQTPLRIVAARPFLKGVGGPGDNVLFAVRKEIWPGLKEHFDKVSLLCRKTKTLWNAIRQLIYIPDFLWLEQNKIFSPPIPTVPVHFLGLDGNKACLYWIPPVNLQLNLVKLKRDPPHSETIRIAEAIFSEKPDPYSELSKEPIGA